MNEADVKELMEAVEASGSELEILKPNRATRRAIKKRKREKEYKDLRQRLREAYIRGMYEEMKKENEKRNDDAKGN